jgi:hypothetical protein
MLADVIESLDGLSGTYRSSWLYRRYRLVAIGNDRDPMTANAFGRALTLLGMTRAMTGNGRVWTISQAQLLRQMLNK